MPDVSGGSFEKFVSNLVVTTANCYVIRLVVINLLVLCPATSSVRQGDVDLADIGTYTSAEDAYTLIRPIKLTVHRASVRDRPTVSINKDISHGLLPSHRLNLRALFGP